MSHLNITVKDMKNLVDKGLIWGEHRVEKNVLQPPKDCIPIGELDFPMAWELLLAAAEIQRSWLQMEEENEGDGTSTHVSFIFNFGDGIKVGLVIEISEGFIRYENTATKLFHCTPGKSPALLFECSSGEVEDPSNYREKNVKGLLKKLNLISTSPVQFVAGIFSKIFHYGPFCMDGNIHVSSARDSLGFDCISVVEEAIGYIEQKMAQKKKSNNKKRKRELPPGSGTSTDPVVIE